jgi:hypothetical protein
MRADTSFSQRRLLNNGEVRALSGALDLVARPILPALDDPEYLTWWKRAIDTLIENGCGLLPYPWGDRVESTIGDIGLWMQITLAILLLRAVVGAFIIAFRRNNFYRSVPRPAVAESTTTLRWDT